MKRDGSETVGPETPAKVDEHKRTRLTEDVRSPLLETFQAEISGSSPSDGAKEKRAQAQEALQSCIGATCSHQQPPPTPPLQGAELSSSSKDAIQQVQPLSHSEDVDGDDDEEEEDFDSITNQILSRPHDEDHGGDEVRVEVLIEALRSGNPSWGQVSEAWDIISAKPFPARYSQLLCTLCKNRPINIGQYIAKDDRNGNWVHAHCLLKSVTDSQRLSIRSPFELAGLLTAPGAHLQGNGQDMDKELPRLLPMGLKEHEATDDGNDDGPDSPDEASLHPKDNRGNEERALVLVAAADKDERQSNGEPQWTDDQREAATYLPSSGAFITVQAFAGTGKTTTARAIIRERLSANRNLRILYVVFGKAAEEEMSKKEEKLVKSGLLSIKTCHSLAWARVMRNASRSIDSEAPKVDALVDRFGLEAYACPATPQEGHRAKERRIRATARRLAGFVRSTLTNFLHSADREITEDHIGIKFRSPPKGATPDFTTKKLLELTRLVWKDMDCAGGVPNHDGYTKQCQIYNTSGFGHRSLVFCPGCGPHAAAPLHLPDMYNTVKCSGCGHNVRTRNQPYDVIIVDEAQDLSPCQFDMLAQGVLRNSPHHHTGASRNRELRPTMYFIGDPFQQIYGWRGATANAFHALFQSEAERNFTLKESFRFGPEVADIASQILRFKGMDVALTGRGPRAKVLYTSRPDWESKPFNGAHVELWAGPGEEPDTATLKELADRFRPQRRAGGWLQPFVVLCRTNKAIASILLHSALLLGGRLPRWFLKGSKKDLLKPSIMKQYVDLYHGRGCLKLKRSGPEFESWSELGEWAEAGDSVDVLIKMSIVEEWEDSQGAGKLMDALEGAKQRSVDSEEGAELMFVTVHQAKGLEYPVVLLADDFQCPYIRDQLSDSFRLLLPEELAKPHYKEESNLLYVAATRAQQVLICNPGLSRFLLMEGRDPVPPESVNEACLDELRDRYETMWSAWASHEGSRHPGGDNEDVCRDLAAKIPFPSGPRKGNMLHIHRHMDFKAYIRKSVLRWHPDKWPPERIKLAMGTSIGPEGIHQAQEEVEDVMKNINRLAKEFQEPVKE